MTDRIDSPPAAPAAGGGLVGHRGPALVVALLSALAIGAVHLAFVTSVTGRRLDGAALEGAEQVSGRLWQGAARVLDVVSVQFLVVVVLVAIVMAVLRRRVALAVQIAVLVAGANVTTQVLKGFLERPDLGLSDRVVNSLPSGHATVAASAAAALVLAVPRRFRGPAAVVGALYTALTGVATLVVGWHRPADAIAAVLVVLAWAGLVTALDRRGSGFGRAGHVRGVASLLVGVAVVLAAVAGVAFSQVAATGALGDAELSIAFAGGAAAVAAISCLAFGLHAAMVAAADPERA